MKGSERLTGQICVLQNEQLSPRGGQMTQGMSALACAKRPIYSGEGHGKTPIQFGVAFDAPSITITSAMTRFEVSFNPS